MFSFIRLLLSRCLFPQGIGIIAGFGVLLKDEQCTVFRPSAVVFCSLTALCVILVLFYRGPYLRLRAEKAGETDVKVDSVLFYTEILDEEDDEPSYAFLG